MPCYDPDTAELPKRLSARLNKLTELLCSVCQQLADTNNPILKQNEALLHWWNHHTMIDSLLKGKNMLAKELVKNWTKECHVEYVKITDSIQKALTAQYK